MVRPITTPNAGRVNPLVPGAHAGHFQESAVSVHAIGAPLWRTFSDCKLSYHLPSLLQ